MGIPDKIAALYEKDTKTAYANLLELEALAEAEDSLYPYVNDFLAMLSSDQYVIRARGIRLLCKQAKWDIVGRLNEAIGSVLDSLKDEKPTAVRQSLKALEDVVSYKKELRPAIRQAAAAMDCTCFRDTMRPLIKKDIQRLTQLIDAQ